jgi:small redox-active disulfide protein 2
MLKIEILYPGCSKCDYTFEKVKQLLNEMELEAELVKITDVFEIIDKGVSFTPALIVDGKIKFQGRVPSIKELREILTREET